MSENDVIRLPEVIVFAGPNGSGKSTITRMAKIGGEYINADDIKRTTLCTDLEAAIKAEELRERMIVDRKDFTFETVLSTDRNLLLLQKAKEKGYFIRGIYVLTCNADINVARVSAREALGDYTYYDDMVEPENFETNNVLFNYPEFGEKLILGKFCQIASGTKFIMGPANHRLCSVTTYPFHVMGGAWTENTLPHMEQLPHKGDTIIGNDVWIGRESVIMPGVKIGDGAIVAAYSVVIRDIPAYTVYGGNPAKKIKNRFDEELTDLLLRFRWWDLEPHSLTEILLLLCDPDLEKVRRILQEKLASARVTYT